MKQLAKIIKCSDNDSEHTYRDFCSICAPFWDAYAVCPTHDRKLNMSGYCKDCKKYYRIER